jgi:hypothetical protein
MSSELKQELLNMHHAGGIAAMDSFKKALVRSNIQAWQTDDLLGFCDLAINELKNRQAPPIKDK